MRCFLIFLTVYFATFLGSCEETTGNFSSPCKNCGEYSDWDEANRAFIAGCDQLDNDNDGIPCETLR